MDLFFIKRSLLGSGQSPLKFLIKILEEDRILVLRINDDFSNSLTASKKLIFLICFLNVSVTTASKLSFVLSFRRFW